MQLAVDTHHEHASGDQLAEAISNAVVHVLGEYTGRGPTEVRTYLDADAITVVLRDALTTGERRLASDGNAPLVLETRLVFQDMMRDELVASVEDLTGRAVHAFMSANQIDPDVGVQTYILEKLEEARS